MTSPGALGAATVGVMGSSREAHETLAAPLGALIAGLELNLLTGAGRGVMTSVSRAFVEARTGRGITIGIVPSASTEQPGVPRQGSPNPYIDLPIYTHLPLSGIHGQDRLSRNHINILTSDVVIVLPGSAGTASEVELAIRYGKPVAAFAHEMRQLDNLNPALTRCVEIGEVETFLRGHL
jgi:uncharacterized protein (TIGR00725 family)